MVRRHVREQDKNVLQVDKHWYWLLKDSGHAIGLSLVGAVMIAVGIATAFTSFLALGLIVLVIALLFFMIEIYTFNKSYYECTEHDFIDHLQTLFTFNDNTVHYNLIREVSIKQTFLGNTLGFAEVHIDAGGEDKIILPFVVNHQQVKEYLVPRIGPPQPKPEPVVVTDEEGDLKELPVPDSRDPDKPAKEKAKQTDEAGSAENIIYSRK